MKYFSIAFATLVNIYFVSSAYAPPLLLSEGTFFWHTTRLRSYAFSFAQSPIPKYRISKRFLSSEEGIKKTIKESYGKASSTYDKFIDLQVRVAQSFVGNFDSPAVKELLDRIPARPTILEIGCGTGVATEKLVKRFKGSKFTASDISPEMLEICKGKLGNQVSNYEIADGENLPASINYDLIVSSLCFHLFRDIPSSIVELGKRSRYSALTIPLEGSLSEWGSLCERFGLKSRLVDFPRKDDLAEALKKSKAWFELVEEKVRQDFSETRGFLDFLRNIGSTKSRSSAPKQNLKALPLEDPLSVTYNIGHLFIAWGDRPSIPQK